MSAASLKPDPSRVEQEATLIKKVLRNQVRGDHRAWLLLNAALLIYASGNASSLVEAAPRAQQALDSGAAIEKLKALAGNSAAGSTSVSPSNEAVPA